MKQEKRMEELQSRREFFKKAAKGVLPIVAAVTLAGIPSLSIASDKTPSGCDYCEGTCHNGCEDRCTGCDGCKGGCDGTCKGSCDDSCKGYCDTTCKGGCGKVSAG